jgi:DNA primase
LDLQSALRFYGLRVNRNGKATCPFHAETNASLSIKDNRYWHCFGCNKSGGLIRFVADYFKLSTDEAIVKIASDFRLGNLSHADQAKHLAAYDASEVKRRIQEKKMQAAEADYLDALTAYLDSMDNLRSAYGIDPFSTRLSDAHWASHKAQYALEVAEAARSEAYSRR